MPITVFSLYPNTTPSSHFNVDYYTQTHLPLVLKTWQPHGLQDVKLVSIASDIDGSPAAFRMIAIMTWESPEKLKEAFADSKTAEILGDAANYTDTSPQVCWGEIVGGT